MKAVTICDAVDSMSVITSSQTHTWLRKDGEVDGPVARELAQVLIDELGEHFARRFVTELESLL